MEVPHRRQPGRGDHHHFAPSADLVAGGLPEGLYNDLCLLADVVGVQLFILADELRRPAGGQVGVVRDGLGDLEAGGIGHVVLQGKEGQGLVPPVGGQLLHQRILRVNLVLRFAFQLGIFPQRVLGVGKGGFQL